jgi:hypothetical protein
MNTKNIFRGKNRQWLLVAALLASVALFGCVVEPVGGGRIEERGPVVVGGPEVVVPVVVDGGGDGRDRDRR